MSDRARKLAAEFDRAFAEPAHAVEQRGADALAIRVGDTRYMLKIADVATIARVPRIVPLPNSVAIQLGIAGLRGNLVTVFSLAALLGLPGDNSIVGASRTNGWIAALARHRGMAVAFDDLEGHVLLGADAVAAQILDVTALLERGGVAL